MNSFVRGWTRITSPARVSTLMLAPQPSSTSIEGVERSSHERAAKAYLRRRGRRGGGRREGEEEGEGGGSGGERGRGRGRAGAHGLFVSAPTGQRSMTLPDISVSRVASTYVPISIALPRPTHPSIETPATSWAKRTQRVQWMHRVITVFTSGP